MKTIALCVGMLVLGLLTGAMLNQDKPIVIVETEHLCYPIQHVEQPLLHR